MFQSFSSRGMGLSLQLCTNELIKALCECIVHLLKGNLQSINRRQWQKFRTRFRCSIQKRITGKERRNVLASKKKTKNSKESIILPSLNSYLEIEKFVLVLASVYNNKSLKTQAISNRNSQKMKLNEISRGERNTWQANKGKFVQQRDSLVDTFSLILVWSSQIRTIQYSMA